jgi:hypothetical protein
VLFGGVFVQLLFDREPMTRRVAETLSDVVMNWLLR